MTDQLLQLLATQAWQIAALAIAVAIVNRTIAKNRPHLAHALWMMVLIKCVTPPIWGHSLGLFSQLQALWKADPIVQQELPSDKPLLMPHHNTDDEIVLAPPANDSPPPGLIAMKDSEAPSTPNVPIILPTKTLDSSFVPEAKPWKPSWPMILLSLVASGALLTISIMVARCVLCLRHIHRHRTTEFDESLNEQLQRLSRKLRLRRVPRIIVSDVLFGPAVIGLWRHVIVLPRCLLKAESRVQEQSRGASEPGSKGEIVALRSRSPEPARSTAPPLSVLDPILAHELLHIRRGDLRTGTLQAIVQSLWWFHPAVWLCNRWLSREAERCCDEQVIAELGCSPAQYARSLLSVIESKHALQPIPVFPGMKPVEITSQRMERIMSLKSNLKKQTPLWCWLAVAALAIVVLPGASPQNQPQASRDSNPIVERRYDVGELVSRLVSEQSVSEAEARGRLLTILNAVSPDVFGFVPQEPQKPEVVPILLPSASQSTELAPNWPPAATPEKLSSIRWDGDHHCVVRQTEASHLKVRESIERFKKHGFRQFEITATCISGPENDIAELIRNSVGEKHELIKKNEVATCIVRTHEADAIQKQVSTSSNRFMVQRPKLLVFNGQEAIVHTGQLKPWIVGFDDKDEPIVQTTTDGFSLQVTATESDHGLLRLQSVATLENATTVQQASISRSSAETPRQTQIPSIHVRRVQTTVELNSNQTLVQCGLTRTHEVKAEATLVILNAKPMASAVASAESATPSSGSMTSNEIKNLTRGPHPNNLKETELPSAPIVNDNSLIEEPGPPVQKTFRIHDANSGSLTLRSLQSESPEADQLIKLVMETREQVSRRLLSTDQHTPWQIMSGIEGLRRDMVLKNGETTVNALEWIQAGPMYQGESWFEKTEHGGRAHPYSKPYWFEGHVNQFLSKFAACQLPLHATFGTPDGPITIQDMINHAKMVVNDKEEVSWTILALCRYLPPDAKWTNAKGEEWSIERLVDIEVGKHVGGPTSPNGGTDGLYALAVARNEYLKTGKPLEGVWLKADEKIRKHIDLAKSQQNPDGTLSSGFFRSSKRRDDFDKRLASSGHLLQFLIHAVSDEQLKEDWIRRAVETTASDIQVNRKEYVSCDSLFAATEALTTYLERTQGISLGLVASPLPMNVASRETSAIETVASGNAQPSQLPKVLIGPVQKQSKNETTLQKLPTPLTLVTYPVGDLVIPVNSGDKKPDYASITELIKATIEPDSWHDGAAIEVDRDTFSLVTRQTPQIHERISAFLQEVRKDTRQIQISCRLMKLTTDEQLNGVEERCSLNAINEHKQWALLTKERTEGIANFLTDEKCHVLLCPTITTFSGMMATIQVDPHESVEAQGNRWSRSLGFGQGSTTTLFHGCAIGVEPRIIGDSSVIRLKHSVYLNLNPQPENASGAVTENEGTSPLSVDESLVSSGQTLLLLIDTTKVSTEDATLDQTSDPQNGARGKYIVMLTVERLEEEEVQVRQ